MVMTSYVARLVSATTGNEKFVKKSAATKAGVKKALGFEKNPTRGYWYGGAFTLAEFYEKLWNMADSAFRSSNPKYKYTSWKDVPADVKAFIKVDMNKKLSKF